MFLGGRYKAFGGSGQSLGAAPPQGGEGLSQREQMALAAQARLDRMAAEAAAAEPDKKQD